MVFWYISITSQDIHSEIDKDNLVGAVYINLSKAFDTIGHAILLIALKSYGIKVRELEWFHDYLFYRSQVVNVGNYSSRQEPSYCGVPQGSILGPLLFTLFYSDFVDHVSNSKIKIYADDTVIYVADKDVIKIEQFLNEDLRNISDYYRKNKLIINLNKGKTEVMLFGSAQRLKTHGKLLQVVYQGHTINFVTEYKYLGTGIDSHLILNDNFGKAYKKTSSCLRLLHQL